MTISPNAMIFDWVTLWGKGGARVQIMENELECLGDRKGHDSHLVIIIIIIVSLTRLMRRG